jgi:phospholipid/cholesterol/gamma-HCH transport system permease protein
LPDLFHFWFSCYATDTGKTQQVTFGINTVAISQTLGIIQAFSVRPITAFGRYVLFCGEAFTQIIYPPVNRVLLFQQMEFIGNKSFLIIVLAAIMIGAVFGLQFGEIFRIFGAESMIGAAASFALSKELAPVVGAFLVTGRSGSSMAAEIATMKVNEQIDAMRVMAVNPIGYLASPRILASILIMPMLAGIFILFGVLSAFIIGMAIYDVDVGIFFEKIKWISQPKHILQGMLKAVVFGAIFSSIGCFKGFNAGGGAKGVGKATTEAVVLSLVTILISDFFISYLQMD